MKTYSPLIVDYNETQFLEQLNRENRERLQDTNWKFPAVPTNPVVFDCYACSLNNPVRYVDPSGHFAFLAALALIGPVGWAAIGVTAVGVAVYLAVPGVRPAVTNAISQAGQSLSDVLYQTKADWIPPNLTPEQRSRWGQAAELYKSGVTLPPGFQLPKELAKKLADLIREGKSIEDAVDAMPELEDYIDGEDEAE